MVNKIKKLFQQNPVVLVCLFIITGLIGYVFIDGISVLIVQWQRLGDLWRLLIVPISIYLAWNIRKDTERVVPRPSIIGGAAILCFGCFAYVAWKIVFIDVCIEAALFSILLGLITLFFGIRRLKTFSLPILYLLLVTTFFDRAIAPIGVFMQHASAMFTASTLNFFGWDVLREGCLLRLPGASLEVARECNGTAQLTALIAFAIPLGVLMHKSAWPKVLLLVATVPLTLLVNVIRIGLIALWNYDGIKSAIHGPHEILRMPFIYPLALVLLFLISKLLEKPFQRAKPASTKTAPVNAIDRPAFQNKTALCVGCAVLLAPLILLFSIQPKFAQYSHSLNEFPSAIGPWVAENNANGLFTFYFGKPDAVLSRTYRNADNETFSLFIARFDRQNVRKRISSVESIFFNNENTTIDIPIDRTTSITAGSDVSFIQNRRCEALSWFSIDGRETLTKNSLRKSIIINSVRQHRNNAAFVAIATTDQTLQQSEALSLIAARLYPYLKNILENAHSP